MVRRLLLFPKKCKPANPKHAPELWRSQTTVDGRNCAFTSWGCQFIRLSHYSQGFIHHPRWWSPDFFHPKVLIRTLHLLGPPDFFRWKKHWVYFLPMNLQKQIAGKINLFPPKTSIHHLFFRRFWFGPNFLQLRKSQRFFPTRKSLKNMRKFGSRK